MKLKETLFSLQLIMIAYNLAIYHLINHTNYLVVALLSKSYHAMHTSEITSISVHEIAYFKFLLLTRVRNFDVEGIRKLP